MPDEDDRPTLIRTGDEEQDRETDLGPPPDFDDTEDEVHLFI